MTGTDIHPDSLAKMRDTIIQSATHNAEIYEPQTVSDGAGGTTVTWVAVTLVARNQPCQDVDDVTKTLLPCRLASVGIGDPDRVRGDGQQVRVPWVITFPHSTDVRDDDRVVIDGRTFECQFNPSEGRSHEIDVRMRVLELGINV